MAASVVVACALSAFLVAALAEDVAAARGGAPGVPPSGMVGAPQLRGGALVGEASRADTADQGGAAGALCYRLMSGPTCTRVSDKGWFTISSEYLCEQAAKSYSWTYKGLVNSADHVGGCYFNGADYPNVYLNTEWKGTPDAEDDAMCVMSSYTIGDEGVNVCPSGYAGISSPAGCLEVAKYYGWEYRGEAASAEHPKGCYMTFEQFPIKVHWNTDAVGAPNPKASPMCVEEAP